MTWVFQPNTRDSKNAKWGGPEKDAAWLQVPELQVERGQMHPAIEARDGQQSVSQWTTELPILLVSLQD